MSRQPREKSHRSQHNSNVSTIPKSQHSSGRSRRNAEQQMKLEQRAAIKASFGANASQLKLTVYIILAVALVLTGIAFFSSNWLEVESRYYGSKFRKLGLWRMCFNSYSAPDDYQLKKFYVGCRWIFADEYKPIRQFLLPGSLTFLNCFPLIALILLTHIYIIRYSNSFNQKHTFNTCLTNIKIASSFLLIMFDTNRHPQYLLIHMPLYGMELQHFSSLLKFFTPPVSYC